MMPINNVRTKKSLWSSQKDYFQWGTSVGMGRNIDNVKVTEKGVEVFSCLANYEIQEALLAWKVLHIGFISLLGEVSLAEIQCKVCSWNSLKVGSGDD